MYQNSTFYILFLGFLGRRSRRRRSCVLLLQRLKRRETRRRVLVKTPSSLTASLSRRSKNTAKTSMKEKLKQKKENKRYEEETLKLEKIYCDVCKTTIFERNYKKHLLRHNFKDYQCDMCSKKYKQKRALTKHKLTIHGDAPLHNCQYCDFVTVHFSYLRIHVMRKHNNTFPFSCQKCDRRFRVRADYMKHIVTHDGEPCICDVCGAKVPNKISLYFHKNYNHTVKDPKFPCTVCNKKLQSQKNLDNHMQQHSQKFICEHCGLGLTRKSGLRKHIRTHSGEKSFSCQICQKTFASATSRKVHLLTHSGVRPYVCTICGQSFTQRPALSVHWKKKHPDATESLPSVSITNIIHSVTKNVKLDDA
ncbi:zinc finger Y-chromosomal protein [Lasioglossum baleicum]|uniref:zinc finger Y-chromosomal protein n=1 Tax=Lasioglossum baleicum TaxID=434251 RepID=UPI003FCE35EB